jgi:hypothetical protein
VFVCVSMRIIGGCVCVLIWGVSMYVIVRV